MIDVEMWAIKDTEEDRLVITKWGRNTWKRKMNPNSLNIVGYHRYDFDWSTTPPTKTENAKYKKLKPIKIRVTEIKDDKEIRPMTDKERQRSTERVEINQAWYDGDGGELFE